jgi:molybdopterin converting factor small subunit
VAATVRVCAFANLRDVLGFATRDVSVDDGMTIAQIWDGLVAGAPALAGFAGSTRFARNGELADPASTVRGGDEVALLPPVGGG